MKSDTEIYALLADADPVVDTDALDTSALTARLESALGHRLAVPLADPTCKEPTMVTHQQPDLETLTPTTPPRSRRGPLVAAAVAVVVILAGAGIAFATGAFESEGDAAAERLAIATELADTWNQGWESGSDPEVLMSVFAEDGVYIDLDGVVTMDEMLNHFREQTTYLTNVDRVGELTPIGDDTYTWASEFDLSGARRRIDWEMELDGDLAARLQWLRYYETVEPASGS